MAASPAPEPQPAAAQIWGGAARDDDDDDDAPQQAARESLYVTVFDTMQDTVLAHEAFLFSPAERARLARLRALSYPARFLLVRLCLRARARWHPLAALAARYGGEVGDAARVAAAVDELCGAPRREVIDLTRDEDGAHEDGADNDEDGADDEPDGDAPFAEDDAAASLEDLLACLGAPELRAVARELRVAPRAPTRAATTAAIVAGAARQATLARAPGRALALSFARDGRMDSQRAVARRLVAARVGRCVRVAPALRALLDRLSLVFFRSTTHSPALLLPALLAAFRKRHYGSAAAPARTAHIFPSRAALLAYEDALRVEARVDEALAGGGGAAAGAGGDSPRVAGARAVRAIWEEVYPRWRDLVARADSAAARAGLERFDCGHVLTRIVCKGAEALAALGAHDEEAAVLDALLAQTAWRRGRRGAWYDRLALVLMTHCARTPANLEAAMRVVVRGLEDALTHTTYRPRLARRLARLEHMLKVPAEERHRCARRLRAAAPVFVAGVRVYPHAAADGASPAPAEAAPARGKTLWVGRAGAPVSVEQLALEHYEDMGFKGFHAEGSIVSTIFGLVFWDVIFAPVPGAFETPYQTAPLDIHEDGFYAARRALIEERLAALAAGGARALLARADARERAAGTLCIGVDWGFARQDLLELADCLGGRALAAVCRVICEDYAQWRGGVPDLLVWNAAAGTCRFVEVKSPNDTLQENQKVWIDVLLGADTAVDLCHVTEKGAPAKRRKRPRGGKGKAAAAASADVESEDGKFSTAGPSDGKTEAPQRIRDSEEPPASSKKRKVEVVLTPRKRKGG